MANTYSSAYNDEYAKRAQDDLPEQDPFVQRAEAEMKARVEDAAKQRAAGTQPDQGGYTQVDLKPEWYKTFLKGNGYDKSAPPLQDHGWRAAEAVTGALGNAANERANALVGKDRLSGESVHTANMGALLGAGSALIGALSKGNSDDFDKQQARAVKDAEALKKNSKTGMSNNELMSFLNYKKTGLRNDELARQYADKAAGVIANANPNSIETRNARVGAVTSGTVAPEVADRLNAQQLKDNRTGFMQTQNQENHAQQFEHERNRLESEHMGEEERADLRRVDQEQRAKQQSLQENYIPGHRWAYDTPPAPAVADRARKFVDAQNLLVNGAQEMKRIQDALLEIGRQNGVRPEIVGPAAFGQYIDKYLGEDGTKQLLARAQLLQKNMVTASREQDNLGVLQQFEKAMEDAVNPVAGTAGAFFRGSAPWDQMASLYTEYGKAKKKSLGLYEEGDDTRPTEDALMKPAEQQVRHFARPDATPRQYPTVRGEAQPSAAPVNVPVGAPAGAAQPDASQPAGDLGRAPVPPMPADARKPSQGDFQGTDGPLNGTYTVSFNGQSSKPMRLTKAQYKALVQKYGMQNVQKAE